MAMTLMVIVGGAAIPLAHSSVDRSRAAGAASYVAGRMALARFEAVRRSAYVAIRFVAQPDGYWLQTYVDGNRNGVLTRDIALGIDPPDHGRRAPRLSLLGSRVRYSAQRDAASIRARSTRATRFKSAARRCSASARQGRRTSGTLFIRGLRGNQFAVRVLGATGRTRILEFNFGARTWLAR